MREKIAEIIRETIQPLVQVDGGEISLISVDDGKIVLRISGMCAGCPGNVYTKKRLIEPLIKEALGGEISFQYEVGPNS